MRILGIVGRKYEGKTTVARAAASHLRQMGRTPRESALADPIKQIAMSVYGLSEAQVTDPVLKEALDVRWGFTPRWCLQRLGTEVARSIHPDTWVRCLLRQIEEEKDSTVVWLVPDVRFLNEGRLLRAAGAVLWRVHRPSVVSTDSHPSEQEIDQIPVDRTLRNDLGLEDLYRAVGLALTDGRLPRQVWGG